MTHRGFVNLREAWYAEPNLRNRQDGLLDEVMLGVYHHEGGTEGEFRMAWYDLRGSRHTSPRLEVFADGFTVALNEFPEVLEWLACHPYDFSVREFTSFLKETRVVDLTPRQPPKK